MKPPRGLSAGEAAAWARLAASVTPLSPDRRAVPPPEPERIAAPPPQGAAPAPAQPAHRPAAPQAPPLAPPPGLDSHWERRLNRAALDPDFTLDLHGHTLDQAYRRLDMGLVQAKAMGARLVLLVTGRSRPVDPADRSTRRGAIRAKVLDWLAAGPHSADIAAVRPAHRRHGGEGALYLVMKRRR